jgi:hypothetical protein
MESLHCSVMGSNGRQPTCWSHPDLLWYKQLRLLLLMLVEQLLLLL